MHLLYQFSNSGNLVRTLKAANPKSNEAKAAITKLLDLKKQYKEVTGTEYKPRTVTQSSNDKEQGSSASAKEVFATKIQQQGELVRSLKAKDAKSVCFSFPRNSPVFVRFWDNFFDLLLAANRW